jgi:hypothetical protein
MNRGEFLRRMIRYLLLLLIGVVAVIAGSKAVSANTCSSCPGKGICGGESDCSKYLPE